MDTVAQLETILSILDFTSHPTSFEDVSNRVSDAVFHNQENAKLDSSLWSIVFRAAPKKILVDSTSTDVSFWIAAFATHFAPSSQKFGELSQEAKKEFSAMVTCLCNFVVKAERAALLAIFFGPSSSSTLEPRLQSIFQAINNFSSEPDVKKFSNAIALTEKLFFNLYLVDVIDFVAKNIVEKLLAGSDDGGSDEGNQTVHSTLTSLARKFVAIVEKDSGVIDRLENVSLLRQYLEMMKK